jgi:tetratricopeptide (TPR) repeat protein
MPARLWWAGIVASFALGLGIAAHADDSTDPEATDETESADENDSSSYPSDALFDFLTAEIAAQRGDVDGALAIYGRLARELHDPQIARRAVETAIRSRAFGAALDSATLLLELDSDSSLAREIMAALLANEGDLAKARERVAAILDKSSQRSVLIMQLSHLFAKFNDKAAVLEATQRLVKPYDAMPEAHYALGVAALVAGRIELALAEADIALERRPSWEFGAILKAQVLRKAAPDELIAFYAKFVGNNPESTEVRMQLGRELAAERKLSEAREQFREAEKRLKNDPAARLCHRPAFAAARGFRRSPGRVHPRAEGRLSRARCGLPRARPGRGRPEALRRGDHLVQEGRFRRLGSRPTQDRHAARARAGAHRGARIPAAHRAALRRGPRADHPGRSAAAARREGVEGNLRDAHAGRGRASGLLRASL